MATISITSDLDVAEKYETLVLQSLAGNSAYIRAKETVQDFVDSGALDQAHKAEVISNIIGGMINNITSSGMSIALQWAKEEKELALRKLELEQQLDILSQESSLKEAQVAQVLNATRLAKVESKRLYGTGVFSEDVLLSLDSEGKIYKETLLVDAQTLKINAEKTLTEQKLNESYAAVHKIIADTYINYGNFTYDTPSSLGITNVEQAEHNYDTLSEMQKEIAKEQAKGYTYNAWANALTGSASMLGTAIAAEYAEFETDPDTGIDPPGKILIQTVLETAMNLKKATTTTSDAVPETTV